MEINKAYYVIQRLDGKFYTADGEWVEETSHAERYRCTNPRQLEDLEETADDLNADLVEVDEWSEPTGNK